MNSNILWINWKLRYVLQKIHMLQLYGENNQHSSCQQTLHLFSFLFYLIFPSSHFPNKAECIGVFSSRVCRLITLRNTRRRLTRRRCWSRRRRRDSSWWENWRTFTWVQMITLCCVKFWRILWDKPTTNFDAAFDNVSVLTFGTVL